MQISLSVLFIYFIEAWCIRKVDISSWGCLWGVWYGLCHGTHPFIYQLWPQPKSLIFTVWCTFSACLFYFSCSSSCNHQFVYKVFAVMSHLILVFPWTQRRLYGSVPKYAECVFLGSCLFFVMEKKGNRFQKHHLVFGGVFLRLYLCARVCVRGVRTVFLFFFSSIAFILVSSHPPFCCQKKV